MTPDEIQKFFSQDLEKATIVKDLESLKTKYLGRKDGLLNILLKSLKTMSEEKKRRLGPAANALRLKIEQSLNTKLQQLQTVNYKLQTDLSLPGVKIPRGHLHPLTIIENQIKEIFLRLNFSVVEGPEIETEYYNFDALNMPKNHPAREMWDTFWLKQSIKNGLSAQSDSENNSKLLLRAHTSPVQIHYMQTHQPPFQIIMPGRVFRFEATDASHEINFHQVEGLMIGEHVNLANFKYIISEFFKKFWGQEIPIRFRPSYFPFTEPSLEVDIQWGDKWLEIMGAGMVHPNVLDNVQYNPKTIQGFAFGMGLERLAMLKYKINDIRLFYSSDLRFINQF